MKITALINDKGKPRVVEQEMHVHKITGKRQEVDE